MRSVQTLDHFCATFYGNLFILFSITLMNNRCSLSLPSSPCLLSLFLYHPVVHVVMRWVGTCVRVCVFKVHVCALAAGGLWFFAGECFQSVGSETCFGYVLMGHAPGPVFLTHSIRYAHMYTHSSKPPFFFVGFLHTNQLLRLNRGLNVI